MTVSDKPMPEIASPDDGAFTDWLSEVDRLCRKRFSLSLDDLPDMNTRSAFDAGVMPHEFFAEEVMTLVREDFADLAEEA